MMPARIGRRDIDSIYAESTINEINEITPNEMRTAALRHLQGLMDRYCCSPAERNVLRERARNDLKSNCGDEDLQNIIDAEIDEYLIDEDNIEPTPVDTKYRPYPVASLPEPIRTYVRSAAASIGCDSSYVALPMLTVKASAIGATRRIAIKPDWVEPAVVWAAIVGDSGSQKSPALSTAMEPVETLQRTEYAEYKRATDDYEAEMRTRDKHDTSPEPTRPIMPARYLSDATVEAIAIRLDDSPRGLLLYRDELSGWIDGFNAYRRGRGGDEAAWLSMYGVSGLRVDRKTGDRPAIYVPYAAVSICGSIQPEILQRCVAGQNTDNGMLARFMLTWPPRRKRKLTNQRINQCAASDVREIYRLLTELNYTTDENSDYRPIDLPLTDTAHRIYDPWFAELAERQQRATGARASALSKIEGVALRLALVVQLVSDPDALTVDDAAMSAGVELARWQIHETERIYALLGVGSPADQESSDLLALIERLGGEATRRQIQHAARRWRGKGDELDRAISRLVARGAIHRIDVPSTGGRRKSRYAINDEELDSVDGDSIGGNGNESPQTPEKADFRYRYQQSNKDWAVEEEWQL